MAIDEAAMAVAKDETDVAVEPRTRKRRHEDVKEAQRTGTAKVIWYPEDGDPPKHVMNGIEFKANVPVDVPWSKTISVPIREEYETAQGDRRSHSPEKRIPFIDILCGNPAFSVDGVRPERKKAAARVPDDPDKYRGYALRWIRESTSYDQLIQRWDGEHDLRDRCGCGSKDVNYLMPFLEARKEQVKEAA